MLFALFVIGNLNRLVGVLLDGFDLRNNARTSLNDSAWYVLTLGTVNGSHSDFLSNKS